MRIRPQPGAILAGVLSAALFFALVTLAALEGGEVVVVETRDGSGRVTQTRVWIADHEGVAWVEAATSQRRFYRDILERPDVDLFRAGKWLRCRAQPVPQPDGHRLIRDLLRRKYGLADWWIGLVADTSGSIAVRLEACGGTGKTSVGSDSSGGPARDAAS